MSGMSELARRALLDDGRPEEAITVNQRALIDKILARYSAEFTVFRELLQNADDACATECELRFSSAKTAIDGGSNSAPMDQKAPLTQWTFRNNGKPFSGADWDRLRRIAEGNPDPDRIGAFGVGFYSLFSVCEEPMVISGSDLMGFFWKGDALFTRRAQAPTTEASSTGVPWTTFLMNLREPTPFPETPLALGQFLATSLTFTASVRRVALYLDDQLLCRLEKRTGDRQPIAASRHLNARSPSKLLRAESLEATSLQVDVEVARSVLLEAAAEAEREKPSLRQTLASAFSKTAGTGLTSMLASAFGGGKHARLAGTSVADAALYDPAQLSTTVRASLHLRVITAMLQVSADAAFSREIERSTKKQLPKLTPFHIIYMGKEEYDATVGPPRADEAVQPALFDASSPEETLVKSVDVHARQLFHGLMPRLDEQGRVFIGFRTHQTTSFSGHIAARFIPTVERESMDFIDRYCARWNLEMLAIGGYITRTVYEHEIGSIGERYKRLMQSSCSDAEKDEGKAHLLDLALHVMQFFSFHVSSPSSRVSVTLEETFFSCCSRPCISLMSTQGARSSDAVRFPSAMLAEFVKDIAVLPAAHIEAAHVFVSQLRARDMVQDITLDDVFGELGRRPLAVDEMVACLKWWIMVAKHPSYEPSLLPRLVHNAVVRIEGKTVSDGEASIETHYQPLSSVSHVLNPQKVPANVPLPPSCLVHDVSRQLSLHELGQVFDWSELSISNWLDYMVTLDRSPASAVRTQHGLCQSPANAERVLMTLAWAWGNLANAQRTHVVSALRELPCIPTRLGMRRPHEAYFASVSLFADLPVIDFSQPVKGNLEKLLLALEVRKHVEIQLIFDRLVAAGDWSHIELVQYLTKNRNMLSSNELERLTNTPIFPREDDVSSASRYRAAQLYEPTDALRALQLPTLAWPGRAWRASSDEARFILSLGLRRHPPLAELLALASATNSNEDLRSRALGYLLERFAEYSDVYSARDAQKYAFVPCRGAQATLLPPTEVFTDPTVSVMGWPVANVHAADALKLQLATHPTSEKLVQRLLTQPTRDLDQARRVFSFLATTHGFSRSDYKRLESEKFVPVKAHATDEVTLVSPRDCYFPPNAKGSEAEFHEIFYYVDFGGAASMFLRNCGVTDEPSVEELARKIVENPVRFYELCKSTETYVSLLRRIATHLEELSSDTMYLVKRSPFLLAIRKHANAEDAVPDRESYALKRASEIVLVDDANAHMLFSEHIFVAPHDDVLEECLYAPLGSTTLSSLVQESMSVTGHVSTDTPRTQLVRATILERTPLFLYEKRAMSSKEISRDYEWLKKALVVDEVGGQGLQLTRRLRYQGQDYRDVQRCSAMASLRNNQLTLHVAENMDIDWFEVAQALSKFLLTRQRLQEVLLFMTVLSTPLRSLKRKGFNVDKILAQQKQALADAALEREELARQEDERRKEEEQARAAEAAAVAEQQRAELERAEAERREQALLQPQAAAPQAIAHWRKQLQEVFGDADPKYLDALLSSFADNQLERASDSLLRNGYPKNPAPPGATVDEFIDADGGFPGGLAPVDVSSQTKAPSDFAPAPPSDLSPAPPVRSTGSGLFQQWRSKFTGKKMSSLANGTSSISQMGANDGGTMSQIGSTGGYTSLTGGTPGSQNDTPASAANIRQHVSQAINASRPDASSVIQSRAQSQEVLEAAQSYCDISGVTTDLRLAGQVSGMKVYVSQELDAAKTLAQNDAALRRLIEQVYRPVGTIFGVDPQCLSVFCDTKGPSIAFNRNGSIFLNLRYYLAWHDDDVRSGRLSTPLVSVYFSLAHELAHNLVSAHNSEHEFFFSSIAEQYFTSLAAYIGRFAV